MWAIIPSLQISTPSAVLRFDSVVGRKPATAPLFFIAFRAQGQRGQTSVSFISLLLPLKALLSQHGFIMVLLWFYYVHPPILFLLFPLSAIRMHGFRSFQGKVFILSLPNLVWGFIGLIACS